MPPLYWCLVQIPFGIQGIDRDDCDGDDCDPTVDADHGAPIWDDNIVEISNEWVLCYCCGASGIRVVWEGDDVPCPG